MTPAIAGGPTSVALSRGQVAFLFEETLRADGGRRAALTFGIDFATEVDCERLDQALRAVVARHPLLRARLVLAHGRFALTTSEAPETILESISDEAGLSQWLSTPIAAWAWPLCRAAVVVQEGRSILRIMAHHMVFDGNSKDVFLSDLLKAYRDDSLDVRESHDVRFWHALIEREKPSLEAAGVAAGERDGLPSLSPEKRITRWVAFQFDGEVVSAVAKAAADWRVSNFVVYLTTLHAAMRSVQDTKAREGITTDIAISTRSSDDADKVGPFVNRARLRSDSSTERMRSLAQTLSQSVKAAVADRSRDFTASTGSALGWQTLVSYRHTTVDDRSWRTVAGTPVLLTPSIEPSADLVIRMVRRSELVGGLIEAKVEVDSDDFPLRLRETWLRLLVPASPAPGPGADALPTL